MRLVAGISCYYLSIYPIIAEQGISELCDLSKWHFAAGDMTKTIKCIELSELCGKCIGAAGRIVSSRPPFSLMYAISLHYFSPPAYLLA